jgi:hypothetical protein
VRDEVLAAGNALERLTVTPASDAEVDNMGVVEGYRCSRGCFG